MLAQAFEASVRYATSSATRVIAVEKECVMDHRTRAPRGANVAAALVAIAVLSATMSATAACVARSGPQATALVELFTSEGCSSCPPADRWLASTFRGTASTTSIPLAFHVDYWDRLGWKDRFAAALYTERQYTAMRANRATFVYTPQVLVQGKSIADWSTGSRDRGTAPAIAVANGSPARADIVLDAVPQQGAVAVKARAQVPRAVNRKDAALYVALVQSGLVSEVNAGENAGVHLAHDHVVRTLRGGAALDAGGAASLDVVFPVPADGGSATTIVAFVQNPKTGDVLQALAMPVSPETCAAAP